MCKTIAGNLCESDNDFTVTESHLCKSSHEGVIPALQIFGIGRSIAIAEEKYIIDQIQKHFKLINRCPLM